MNPGGTSAARGGCAAGASAWASGGVGLGSAVARRPARPRRGGLAFPEACAAPRHRCGRRPARCCAGVPPSRRTCRAGGAGETVHRGQRGGHRDGGKLGVSRIAGVEDLEQFARGLPAPGPGGRVVAGAGRRGGGDHVEQVFDEVARRRTGGRRNGWGRDPASACPSRVLQPRGRCGRAIIRTFREQPVNADPSDGAPGVISGSLEPVRRRELASLAGGIRVGHVRRWAPVRADLHRAARGRSCHHSRRVPAPRAQMRCGIRGWLRDSRGSRPARSWCNEHLPTLTISGARPRSLRNIRSSIAAMASDAAERFNPQHAGKTLRNHSHRGL